jgi:hypothetical protein
MKYPKAGDLQTELTTHLQVNPTWAYADPDLDAAYERGRRASGVRLPNDARFEQTSALQAAYRRGYTDGEEFDRKKNPASSSTLRYVAIDRAGDIVAVENSSDEALDVLREHGVRAQADRAGADQPRRRDELLARGRPS